MAAIRLELQSPSTQRPSLAFCLNDCANAVWHFFMLAVLAVVMSMQVCMAAVDQNLDGVVDVVDIQEVVNLQLGNTTPSRPFQGDVNLDGSSDVVDVQLLTNEILGISSTFTMGTLSRLLGGVVGTPYLRKLEAYGGNQPYAWTYSGTLPNGLVFSADGTLSGTPITTGLHAITFEAIDSLNTRVSLQAVIAIWPTWQAPVAVDDLYYTAMATPVLLQAPGLLINDSCPLVSPLTTIIQSGPTIGTLTLGLTGSFSYTPALGQTTPAQFSYLLFNDVGGVAIGNVTIIVGNLPPIVREDRHVATSGTMLIVPTPGLLTNDTDPDLDAMSTTLVSQATNGTVTISTGGGFTYSPNPSYVGVDSFTYRVTDARGAWADGVCKIRVMQTIPTETMSVVLTVSPNPVRTGEPMTITAEVSHSWSLMPDFDYVREVETEPVPTSLTLPADLAFHSWVNATTSRWQVTLPNPTLPYGLHTLAVKATAYSATEATDRERFVAYTAPAVHVGTGQTHATILAGIQAVQPLGAVIIHPGTYSGTGNTMLPGFDCVLAGIGGRDVTTINCTGVDSAFAFDGSQSSMAWTDYAIFMGLSVINATNSAIHIKAGVTFFRMSLRDNAAPNHGAGFFLWNTGSALPLVRVFESEFLRNTAGSLDVGQTSAYGGAYYAHGLNFAGFHLFDSVFIENRALSAQGAEYGVGFANHVDGCVFEDNLAKGSHACSSGALLAWSIIRNSVFRRNKAESAPNIPAGQLGTSAAAGAVRTSGETSFFNCLFEDNSAIAVTNTVGGAVQFSGCGSSVVFDQCKFIGNIASGGGDCHGGAVGGSYEAARLRADHCQFINNTASTTSTSTGLGGGGAIGFTWSPLGTILAVTSSSYCGVHHCLFTGNKTTGNLLGNSIYVGVSAIIQGIPPSVGYTVEVVGCTVSNNQNGVYAIRVYVPNLIVRNTIVFASETPLNWTGNPVTFGTSLSIFNSNLHPVLPAAFVGINGNISLDPLFVSVPGMGDHFLSQAPGQTLLSPCVNTGGQSLASWPMLFDLTTSSTSFPDTGIVDMGYHYFPIGTPIVPRSPLPPSYFLATYPCNGMTPSAAFAPTTPNPGLISTEDEPSPPPPGPCG